MMKIPARFQRMAVAFEESSGSEHSPAAESCTDLSDLVKSFMERDYYCEGGDVFDDDGGGAAEKVEDGVDEWSLSEALGKLRRLLGGGESDEEIRRKIVAEAELACRLLEEKPSSSGFKRKLMTHLRKNGYGSGLCKTKWEKFGQFPAGDYEYVDVTVDGNRYIVEVFLVGEFEIARPTSQYVSLLKAFPQIYVGKEEELKKIVKVMCRAMRESIKSKDMHIPPWRRNGYMQAKWFGSYKRTTNEVPSKAPLLLKLGQSQNPFAAKRSSLGFEAKLPLKTYQYCRGEFGRRNNINSNGIKVGHLSAAFDGQGIGML
ncbi:DUF506 domain-containing protein [Cucumis melo var. makuwa]|nr:uncharacterized protein LOC103498221 [Cucumis melo]KAA0054314.1 DUF506 domain-containing protein [Cucumis melo var. makuwa]TYK12350.1 DUF506 domain-containing protein [Cucumis melo var. makuwa]